MNSADKAWWWLLKSICHGMAGLWEFVRGYRAVTQWDLVIFMQLPKFLNIFSARTFISFPAKYKKRLGPESKVIRKKSLFLKGGQKCFDLVIQKNHLSQYILKYGQNHSPCGTDVKGCN